MILFSARNGDDAWCMVSKSGIHTQKDQPGQYVYLSTYPPDIPSTPGQTRRFTGFVPNSSTTHAQLTCFSDGTWTLTSYTDRKVQGIAYTSTWNAAHAIDIVTSMIIPFSNLSPEEFEGYNIKVAVVGNVAIHLTNNDGESLALAIRPYTAVSSHTLDITLPGNDFITSDTSDIYSRVTSLEEAAIEARDIATTAMEMSEANAAAIDTAGFATYIKL